MTRVLAFTPSAGRAILLDRCIKQMQLQTYALKHFIYLNTPQPNDLCLMEKLAARLTRDNKAHGAPSIAAGLQKDNHYNSRSGTASNP